MNQQNSEIGLQEGEKSIIDSDLVFSPAQVTEHCHVELKDQEISQETKDRFEKLKRNSILKYFH